MLTRQRDSSILARDPSVHSGSSRRTIRRAEGKGRIHADEIRNAVEYCKRNGVTQHLDALKTLEERLSDDETMSRGSITDELLSTIDNATAEATRNP